MNEELLDLASSYSSKEEFKQQNYPKYLIARRLGLLPKMFPAPTTEVQNLKGVYLLYRGHKLSYVAYSAIDYNVAIAEHKDAGLINFDNYKVYPALSDSDALVLCHYLINKYRPQYNNNFGENRLTLHIPGILDFFGEPIKGTI